jgi:hypothetical protein
VTLRANRAFAVSIPHAPQGRLSIWRDVVVWRPLASCSRMTPRLVHACLSVGPVYFFVSLNRVFTAGAQPVVAISLASH